MCIHMQKAYKSHVKDPLSLVDYGKTKVTQYALKVSVLIVDTTWEQEYDHN